MHINNDIQARSFFQNLTIGLKTQIATTDHDIESLKVFRENLRAQLKSAEENLNNINSRMDRDLRAATEVAKAAKDMDSIEKEAKKSEKAEKKLRVVKTRTRKSPVKADLSEPSAVRHPLQVGNKEGARERIVAVMGTDELHYTDIAHRLSEKGMGNISASYLQILLGKFPFVRVRTAVYRVMDEAERQAAIEAAKAEKAAAKAAKDGAEDSVDIQQALGDTAEVPPGEFQANPFVETPVSTH